MRQRKDLMAVGTLAKAGTPRHVFGRMVRHYREKAGMTRPAVAAAICKSVSLVDSIENGNRAATDLVTGDLDHALGAGGDLVKLREAMSEGIGYQPFRGWLQDWHENVEPRARRIRWFEPNVVPGLLQTEDYARAVYSTRFGLSREEVARRVASRMKRQEILARDEPPAFWAILDEWALRRPVGGRYVMAEQVSRLAEAAERPCTMIRVVPAGVGAHEGLYGGGFAIADLAGCPSVAYQEGSVAEGGWPIRSPVDLEALEIIWDTLGDQALSRTASLALLEEVAKSWTSPA
jgi:transcriptional regulator with XRE-family HTH domain